MQIKQSTIDDILWLYYFKEAKEVDIIIVSDFSIGAYSKSRLQQILSEYVQVVKLSTRKAGATLDHMYLKKSFLEDYEI